MERDLGSAAAREARIETALAHRPAATEPG